MIYQTVYFLKHCNEIVCKGTFGGQEKTPCIDSEEKPLQRLNR